MSITKTTHKGLQKGFRVVLAALVCVALTIPSMAWGATTTQERALFSTSNQKATQGAAANDIIVYRLFNGRTGEHLYTTSNKERMTLKNERDWFYEGVAWRAPKKSNTPVYRVFNVETREHLYTSDAHERDVLSARDEWRYEGICWYSDDAKTIKVMRLYSSTQPKIGSHHYTLDTKEVRVLSSRGWKNEGVAWYAARGRASVKDAWVKAGKNWQWWDAGVQKFNYWVTTAKTQSKSLTPQREVYRINGSGNMVTGLFKVGSNQYYANPVNGRVQRNVNLTVNGVSYYADDTGVLHEKIVVTNSKVGNHIAAAAVALSGTTSFVAPPGKTYDQRLHAVPPNKSAKGNWTVYNKVWPKIDTPYQWHAHCGLSVRRAVMWAGADDNWSGIGATKGTYDYLMGAKNWKRVGEFSRETGVGVALKPGDVLLTKKSAKQGVVGHICIYVGKTAAQKKYKGTNRTVFESGGGGYWPRLDKLIRPGVSNVDYYVFRCTTKNISGKYAKYYASERNKYLP